MALVANYRFCISPYINWREFSLESSACMCAPANVSGMSEWTLGHKANKLRSKQVSLFGFSPNGFRMFFPIKHIFDQIRHIYIYIYIYIYMYICMGVCWYICICMFKCTLVYVCMCMCMYVCVCMCMYRVKSKKTFFDSKIKPLI